MSDESTIFGIDLGTTHTLVAVLDGQHPRVLLNELGESLVPSAVALDDSGHLIIGAAALEYLDRRPRRGARRFKTDMGTDAPHRLGDDVHSSTHLSAALLREVKAMAEAAVGHPVRRAVVTVPAWFQEPQRAATREAAQLAGLVVERIVNEPTAAALAHGLHDSGDPRTVVVVDLGGGTFDVSVLEYFDGVVEVVASAGDSRLGGEDFTDALLQVVLDQSGAEPSLEDRTALRRAIEEAKRSLSERERSVVDAGVGPAVIITRAELDSAIAPLLSRVKLRLHDVLAQASISAGEVDDVLLVGGATRTPALRRIVQEVFGQAPRDDIDPDTVVALGAAVQGALLAGDAAVGDLVVTDVVPHTLGVEILRFDGDLALPDYFLPVVHRNTALPVRQVSTISTIHRQQKELRVRVFQGESRFASANRLLGEFHVRGLPPAPDDDGQPIELVFTHDLNGLLEVEARVLETGQKAALIIEQRAGRMSDEERARALEELKRLKVHPRELLPNRVLMERAQRIYERLTHKAREGLDPYLFAFEAALEQQDTDAIRAASDGLREAVRRARSEA